VRFSTLTSILWYLKPHKWAGRYGDGISLVLPTFVSIMYIQHSTVSSYENPVENTHYIKKRQREEGMAERFTNVTCFKL